MYLKKGCARQKEQPGQRPWNRCVAAHWNHQGCWHEGRCGTCSDLVYLPSGCIWGVACGTQERTEKPELIGVGFLGLCLTQGECGNAESQLQSYLKLGRGSGGVWGAGVAGWGGQPGKKGSEQRSGQRESAPGVQGHDLPIPFELTVPRVPRVRDPGTWWDGEAL